MNCERTSKKSAQRVCVLIFVVVLLLSMLSGCAGEKNTNEDNSVITDNIKVVKPLPNDLDIKNLNDRTFAAGFKKSDIYLENNSRLVISMTVYNYDLYDIVDMANLKVGDVIEVVGEDVLIKSMDKSEYGDLNINGGIDNNGITLCPGDGGTYYEILMNDLKHYYEIGKTILPVGQEFTLRDSSNHDKTEQTFLAGDLIDGLDEVYADFQPTNTLVTVQDGFITEMSHLYSVNERVRK